ncbi:MAG: GntR family transcriptional regulator [Thiobacillus sp.]
MTGSARRVASRPIDKSGLGATKASLRVRPSPAPYYAQVRDALRARILGGSLASHEQLPSEAQLTELFGVSRVTVRQALKDLENEGLIFRVHGKGSFVSKPKAFQNLTALQSFGEAMHPQGYETYSKLVAIKEVAADAPVAEKLALPIGSQVIEIKRVRYLNRQPMAFEVSYFPLAIGRRLSREDLSTRDIIVILENDFRVDVGFADLVLGAHLADASQARLLKIEPGSPMLHIERLTMAVEGEPLMYEHLFHRGDSFRYTVRVARG